MFILFAFGFRFALAQGHLEPDADFPEKEAYMADIKQVFAEAYAPNVILRVLDVLALGRDNTIAGIRETNGTYEAFIITSSLSVWDLELVRQIKAGKKKGYKPDGSQSNGYPYSPYIGLVRETPSNAADVKTKTEAAPISASLARRIAAVWEKMLLDAKPPEEKREGFDGETFVFSAPAKGRGELTAQIWSPAPESKTGRLVSLVEALGKFAKEEIGEDALDQAVRKFED